MKKIYYFIHNKIPNKLIYLISIFENFFGHLFPNFAIKLRFYFKYGVDDELEIIPLLSNQKKNTVDVGSNVGIYSFELSKYFNNVYSYEPNKFVYKRFKNLNIKNLYTFNYGLSDKNIKLDLIYPKYIYGLSTFNKEPQIHKIKEYSKIKSKTVIFDDLEIKNIGLVKIDTEGYEIKVIKGMMISIKKNLPTLIVEVDEFSLSILKKTLIPLNYRLYIHKNRQLFKNLNKTTNIIALNKDIYSIKDHKIFEYLKHLS